MELTDLLTPPGIATAVMVIVSQLKKVLPNMAGSGTAAMVLGWCIVASIVSVSLYGETSSVLEAATQMILRGFAAAAIALPVAMAVRQPDKRT